MVWTWWLRFKMIIQLFLVVWVKRKIHDWSHHLLFTELLWQSNRQELIWSHKKKYTAIATDYYHWNATTASEMCHSSKTTYSTSTASEVCQNLQINTPHTVGTLPQILPFNQEVVRRHIMELRCHHFILDNMHTHPFASYLVLSLSCESHWWHDRETQQCHVEHNFDQVSTFREKQQSFLNTACR